MQIAAIAAIRSCSDAAVTIIPDPQNAKADLFFWRQVSCLGPCDSPRQDTGLDRYFLLVVDHAREEKEPDARGSKKH